MPSVKRKFFSQKGISLASTDIVDHNKTHESLNSLVFKKENIDTLSFLYPSQKQVLIKNLHSAYENVKSRIAAIDFKYVSKMSVSFAALTVFLSVFVFQLPIAQGKQQTPLKYSIFSAKPLVMESINQDLTHKDSRATKVDGVFSKFDCPLYGMGETFVNEADANDIPYWVVAAISFQESGCGKKTPLVNGVATSNAWGWAVYGGNVFEFQSFEHGIEVVSRYMSKKFYSKGVTELCDIMKIYTPPSNGSWCQGVQYFGDMIQDYKTPQV